MSPTWALGALILLAAFLLRCVGVAHRGLWYDELLSANFAGHGPVESLLTTARFDVHPPLYYLQLSLWMLLGTSAVWLMANSIVWSTAAVALLMIAVGRLYGTRAGLLAAALLAVAPAALAYSDQVRMYAMLSALMVWVWWSQERWAARPDWRSGVPMALAQLCVIYTHAAGIFMLSGCVLYGAVRAATQTPAGRFRRWLLIEAVVGVLAVPGLLLSALHKVAHPLAPTVQDMFATWMFMGSGAARWDPLHLSLAAMVGGALLAITFTTPRLRLQIASLIFAPLLAAAFVSHALKPIWLDRIFTPVIPFIALVFARYAADAGPAPVQHRSPRMAAVVALGLVWLVIGAWDQATRVKGDGNLAAAAYVRAHARTGDEIVFNSDLELWAFMWAFAGPDWGDPIRASSPSDPGARTVDALPAPLRAWFEPPVTLYRVRGVVVRLSDGAPPIRGGDVIAIGTDPRPEPGRVLVTRRSFPPLRLERWRPLADAALSPPAAAPPAARAR